MVYGRYNELVNGVYKPTFNWGAPSCTHALDWLKGKLKPFFVPYLFPIFNGKNDGFRLRCSQTNQSFVNHKKVESNMIFQVWGVLPL